MIPEYDFDILPCIEHPLGGEREATKKYLGGRAITGQKYATLNIFMTSNDEAKSLYDFWKDDCNYGTIPFLIALPIFGMAYDKNFPTTMAQFYEDISMEKIDTHWKQGVKVKILGEVSYIQDDSLNYIVDDSGNYIVDDMISNSNKEITYG